MGKKLTVSVIMPTYNSAEYIEESLKSILEQTYDNIEIIIVDDGSTDKTKEVLRKYMKNITYIYKTNGGQASARNKGFELSKGELIAFIDSDDIWKKEKIENQVKLFKNEKVGLVYSGVEWFNEKGIIKKNIPQVKGMCFEKLLVHNFITTSSTIIKRTAFQKFNENEEFRTVEDYDLWLRVSKNWEIDFNKEIFCSYRVHSKNSSSNKEIMYNKELVIKNQYFQKASKKLKVECLWNSNFEMAYTFNDQGNKKDALKFLKKAFINKPFKIKNIKLFLKIILKI